MLLMAKAEAIELSEEERGVLHKRATARSGKRNEAQRAGVILRAAAGMTNREISRELGIHYNAVGKTRARFVRERLGALRDRPRSGRKPTIAAELKRRILSEVTQPAPGLARWSVRSMARHLGVSKDTVQRLWAQNELKPHLKKVFKLSSDPEFEVKFWDVIGLYLNPPERAVVLCSDEKSQIQALQRTQPGLPLGLGHVRTETHDYYRHGTVTLFAALDYLEGKVFAHTAKRHTHRQWLDFLKQLDRQIAPHLDIHLVLDNYATHQHATVRKWLAKRPRIKLHFVPTGSSWLNLVERFFRDLSQQAILPGSFASVAELTDALMHYLARHNLNPKRYVWRADGAAVLAKIQRAWEAALTKA
jgi:transposase/transcriptional regulator with XRE-family HTH domain